MNLNQILVAGLYSLTVLVSAFLLFVVQPMVGAIVLPHLGGSSTVWTTTMLFFQLMLLIGYVYAHGIAQSFSVRKQVWIHAGILGLALFFLPLSVPTNMLSTQSSPALYLLLALISGPGLPVFVVSSSAPLFQHWFGTLTHPHADDPYYLYAASNVGSILALFSYPFLIDRFTGLGVQRLSWTICFATMSVLAAVCGLIIFSYGQQTENDPAQLTGPMLSINLNRKLYWLLITFIPSSLMLGVTQFITTDLASVPLLWVLPLGVYLFSFIMVFARLEHPLWLYKITLPPSILIVFTLTFARLLSHIYLLGLHLVILYFICMYFHGELASDRPETEHLTEFYIFLALGGALGGIFNALIAPAIFDSVLEYYLVIGLALGSIKLTFSKYGEWRNALSWGYGILVIGTLSLFTYYLMIPTPSELKLWMNIAIACAGISGLYFVWRYPFLLNAFVGILFFFGYWVHDDAENVIAEARSFYGHYRVLVNENRIRTLMSGTTEHGFQVFEHAEPQHAPTGYYHPNGPMGDVVLAFDFGRVGIGGLGTGGLAAYANPGDSFHFFEIDPTVERLARDYFGYLDKCGSACDVHIGDARRLISERPIQYFDLLIMDAYSSDAIPTHLLTREAVKLYMSRVKKNGAVIFHVSNRHLNLKQVIGAIANDLNFTARTREYYPPLDDMNANASTYVVVTRTKDVITELDLQPGWHPTEAGPILWTDQYTNIVSVLADEEDGTTTSQSNSEIIPGIPDIDFKSPINETNK